MTLSRLFQNAQTRNHALTTCVKTSLQLFLVFLISTALMLDNRAAHIILALWTQTLMALVKKKVTQHASSASNLVMQQILLEPLVIKPHCKPQTALEKDPRQILSQSTLLLSTLLLMQMTTISMLMCLTEQA